MEKVCNRNHRTPMWARGISRLKIVSQSRVVKVCPECLGGVRLSTEPDKDGNCRDLGEEDC